MKNDIFKRIYESHHLLDHGFIPDEKLSIFLKEIVSDIAGLNKYKKSNLIEGRVMLIKGHVMLTPLQLHKILYDTVKDHLENINQLPYKEDLKDAFIDIIIFAFRALIKVNDGDYERSIAEIYKVLDTNDAKLKNVDQDGKGLNAKAL